MTEFSWRKFFQAWKWIAIVGAWFGVCFLLMLAAEWIGGNRSAGVGGLLAWLVITLAILCGMYPDDDSGGIHIKITEKRSGRHHE